MEYGPVLGLRQRTAFDLRIRQELLDLFGRDGTSMVDQRGKGCTK